MTDMRTPLKRVRGLGSAKEGTDHFWAIRLSSVALVPLSFFVVGLVFSLRGAGYAEVRASLSQPLIAVAVTLFLAAGLYHMRLGMQIIIEDYIHSEGGKLSLLIANTLFTIGVGALCLFALAKLAFGG